MRLRLLVLAFVSFLSAGSTGLARAQDDNRMIGKFDHTKLGDYQRTVSLYLTFKDDKSEGLPSVPSGDETRFYAKVWENLFLQVTTESQDTGTLGYMFTFSSDMEDQNSLTPEEPKDSPTLREVAAADFRTDDNFAARPLKGGPGTSKDRGAFRIVHYKGFDAEIRVLEFNIGDAKLGKKPFFKSLSCLVTVKEKEPKKSAK